MKLSRMVMFIVAVLAAASSLVGAKKSSDKMTAPTPDKAYLQKIWDGWSTLDPANVSRYYAAGPHTFFDIAPLKYSSWEEYQKTVTQVLADFKSAKFTVNDDADVHPGGTTCGPRLPSKKR